MTAVIFLPWPAPELSQNSRAHWSKRARAVKSARNCAILSVQEHGLHRMKWTSAKLEWSFRPPDNRRRDVSNVIGSCKAYIDGIADALGIDDSTFENHWPVQFDAVDVGGWIMVQVTPRLH
jgi:crossover junction endodeoxyribonuclease RusA